jgi:hypothetical protein
MSALAAAKAALDANANARAQAERRAGDLWRDVVFDRLTVRSLEPLDQEERRFRLALEEFDDSIARAQRLLA